MIGAAKRKSISPPGLSALWSILLLVVALCLPETRVWGFAITPQPASGVFESASPSSIGENTIAWQYDASGSLHAAKTTPQLEFGFVKNLENPNFVIYKASHLEANPGLLRAGESKLNLPNLGNEALNWAQNQQQLQKAMNIGKPIRDLSPNYGGGFLQRERDFLMQGGWKYDPSTGYWSP